jgi:ubiquinone/menaquinone biosynthesis C-methylase UbiE
MRLSMPEFRAMNNPLRRIAQRSIEFPLFRRMGLSTRPGDLLEIGCGSGYGAQLLSSLQPRSYVGIDLMPEQIELARQRLPEADFCAQDATDLANFSDGSKDTIVIFGVLHHIPAWQVVLTECYRVLRPGGRLFVEEPGRDMLDPFERVFHWGHAAGGFRLIEFEAFLRGLGFQILGRYHWLGFGSYACRKQ